MESVRREELKTDHLGIRIGLLIFSCFLIGLGVSLAISTTLGADVVALVWEGLNHTFGVSMSMSNIIVSLVFLAITLSINWRYIGLGTVVGMFLQSFFIHNFDFSWVAESDFVIKIIAMVLGISILSIGCAVYALAELGVGPYIAAVLASSEKFKVSVTKSKFIIDASCVILAAILGKLPSIGPVVALFISGLVMDYSMILLKKCLPFLK